MTWLPDVFMLEKDRQTDAELLLDVHKHGFSRIPVYSRDKFVENFLKIIFNQYFHRSNVIGIVKLRDFALITPEQYHLTVKHMMEFHTRMYSKIIRIHILISIHSIDPFGYTKTTASLYHLMQEFLKCK